MAQKSELPSFLFEKSLWTNHSNPVWPATLFLIQRNLARFFFPSKSDPKQAQKILELLKEAFLKSGELEGPCLLKAEELTALDKEFLFERFLCLEGFQNTLSGQGFLIDGTARFMAQLNVEDHLCLQIIDGAGEWKKCWENLSKLEAKIGSSLEYAYSPRFGYLTSDSSHCGTGLRVFVYLHVPALIHKGQLEETLLKQKEEEIIATGIEGTLKELVGDFLLLRNRFTLGIAEEDILHSVQGAAMHLAATEKALRTQLQEKSDVEIKDAVSRAYGLLTHSYQLQTKEALGALSLIKLGVDIGWVSGIADYQINEMMFACRRGHLTHLYKEESVDPPLLPRKRAEFLHGKMQGAVLKI